MTRSSGPRAVIDTNLLVSGLISNSGAPYLIQASWVTRQFTCVVSDKLLNEYRSVVSRPRLAQSFVLPADGVAALLTVLFRTATVVTLPNSFGFGLRDAKDEMVIATAIAGNAQYIVSGDRDLLEFDITPFSDAVRIINAAEFVERLTSATE